MAKKNVDPIVSIPQRCNLHPIRLVIINEILLSEAIGIPDGKTDFLSSEANHDQN